MDAATRSGGRTAQARPGDWIESDVPPRLDALGFSPWHLRMVLALGITWLLDGLEASLIANLGPTLMDRRALGLSAAQVGLCSSSYLGGQVLGALLFGWLTDRLGRKKLFLITLGLYLAATALSGAAPDLFVFAIFRFLAGAGIGGEYSAINSAIDELCPARLRGRIDLAINGSYWLGAAGGAGLTLLLLDPRRVPIGWGFRLAFATGAVLGLAILFARRHLPESPRWLLLHGRVGEAERVCAEIERAARARPTGPDRFIQSIHPKHDITDSNDLRGQVRLRVTGAAGFKRVLEVLLLKNRRRTLLCAALMLTQAFLYNGVFFSYGLILTRFHGVAPARVGLYLVPFALGNFLGPLLLGPLFDRLGRRMMIPLTYAASGLLLLVAGFLFWRGALDATTQTLAWCAVFFFASAAASAAYLTASELFPIELRGMVIAIFYAFATLCGAAAPALFGRIAGDGARGELFAACALAAGLMIGAAMVARLLGVDAEGKSLEAINADGSL